MLAWFGRPGKLVVAFLLIAMSVAEYAFDAATGATLGMFALGLVLLLLALFVSND